MNFVNYIRQYQFNYTRVIGISDRFKIYDEGFCISGSYNNLDEAEESLKKFVVKTVGLDYNNRKQL